MIDFVCPRCHKNVSEYPALSRRDNRTDICSFCGTEEAMIDMMFANAKQNALIKREFEFLKNLVTSKE